MDVEGRGRERRGGESEGKTDPRSTLGCWRCCCEGVGTGLTRGPRWAAGGADRGRYGTDPRSTLGCWRCSSTALNTSCVSGSLRSCWNTTVRLPCPSPFQPTRVPDCKTDSRQMSQTQTVIHAANRHRQPSQTQTDVTDSTQTSQTHTVIQTADRRHRHRL